jgi:hypothetical protein
MNTSSNPRLAHKVVYLLLCLLIAGSLLFGLQPTQAAQTAQTPDGGGVRGTYRGASQAVQFDVSPALRDIRPIQVKPGEVSEIPERPSGLEGALGPQDSDPLVQSTKGPGAMPAPITSFNGPPNISLVSPPDPVGDVGPNHYVAMSNLSFQIFDKLGNSLYGPAANNTLWAGFGGDCETDNAGDPIVIYDQLADRWMLTQFTASGPTYFNCVALSTSGDPTGTYYRWAFSTGINFPDYPKYGMWPDAYYISTRDFENGATYVGVGAYALNRAQMIAGNPAPQVVSFLVPINPNPYNIGDGLLPADLDGTILPPPGSPHYFVGSMDDGGPYGAPQDALTLWKFVVDWATPANSSFTLANTLPIASFDTLFPCTPTSRDCIPQPGTTQKVDILSYRQRPLWRLAYRNFGTHEALVTNQSVEASPSMAGIRWWELRSPNSSPVIYQEGTYAPGIGDGIHRWMGSIAMDGSGNMALGYSASNGSATFPSSWYTGRLYTDPLGTLPQGEAAIINGTGSQTGSARWGDYTSMNVDPVDDCTFWYVNEYVPVSSSVGWQLRIGSFKFPECTGGFAPDFSLEIPTLQQAVCAPADASYTVNVNSLNGFSDPVTLSASGHPTGTTSSFSVNPVIPTGSSLFTVGNTGAADPGSYTITITGEAPTSTHTANIGLDIFSAAPAQVTLVSPGNFATNQPLSPTFTWNAADQGETYTIDIATDSAFTNVVYSASGLPGTSHTPAILLDPSTVYFWRVKADNACGSSEYSQTFLFTTEAPAGTCPVGTAPNELFFDDFESGAVGWTHSGTGDTWALSTTNPHSTSTAFHANNPASVSDQRLVSPAIALPSGENPVLLSFWNYQYMETSGTSACYDGGILEVSTNGGSTWTQVPNADLLTDPYNGPISTSFGNPLAGLDAWCGNNPQPYLNSVVDVSDYAGLNAQFRFRLGSDTSVSAPGWDIDDVSVQSCQPSGYAALLGLDQSQTTLPESSVAYVFYLLNLGQADTYDLAVSGNTFTTTLLSPATLNLAAGELITVTVQVDTPPVIADNLDITDVFTLTATSTGDPSLDLQTTGTTRSLVTAGATLTPADQSLSGAPGDVVDYTFELSNTGNFTDTFTLAISGNSWETGAPASLELAPGATTPITVQVGIPPQPAGLSAIIVSDSFTLTATSSLLSSLVLEAGGTTSATANPAVTLAADDDTREAAPGQAVVYTLQVTNTGDFPDSYSLSASGDWGPSLSAASTGMLEPGESATLELTVSIPAAAASGDSEPTDLTATSDLDAGVEATASVTTTAAFRQLFLPLIER